MPEPRGELLEPGVARPLRMSRHLGEGPPLRLGEARDGQPPIVPGAGIDVVRGGRLVRGAVAVARPDPPAGRPFQDGGAADEETDLRLRGVDPLPLARPGAMEEGGENGQAKL